jgi:hypothetical protein
VEMAGQLARRGDAGTLEVVELDAYPALRDGVGGLVETLEANVGSGLQFSDLTRVTVPTGGGTAFEIPDELTGEPETVRSLEGVLVHWQPSRVWWEPPKAGESELSHTPPACTSVDGKVPLPGGAFADGGYNANRNLPIMVAGQDHPIRTCKGCPMDEWGSTHKEGRKGKGCKQQILLYLLQEGEILPIIISVPPTSLAVVRTFMVKLSARYEAHYSGFKLSFSLKKIEKSGEATAQLVLRLVGTLDGLRRTSAGGPEEGSAAASALAYSREFASTLTVEDIITASGGNTNGSGVMNGEVLNDAHLGGDFATHELDEEPALS